MNSKITSNVEQDVCIFVPVSGKRSHVYKPDNLLIKR